MKTTFLYTAEIGTREYIGPWQYETVTGLVTAETVTEAIKMVKRHHRDGIEGAKVEVVLHPHLEMPAGEVCS